MTLFRKKKWKKRKKETTTTKIFHNTEIYSRNRNAWIEKKKCDLFQRTKNLRLDLLPRCVLQADLLRAGNQEQSFHLLFLALKEITTPLKSQSFPPSFASLLGPRCGSLHTRIGAIRCGWSAPGLPPSDWWGTPCMCWCLYPAGELSVSCVHIVMYTTQRFFMWLAPTCHVGFLSKMLWRS